MRKTSDIIWQDSQHQMLFQLLDQVAADGATEDVIRQLHFYAESHFALEEQYMAQLEYPGRAAHRAAHDKFRAELEEMSNSVNQHDAISRSIISTFLSEWLKRHIFGIDKELEAFLLERGVH